MTQTLPERKKDRPELEALTGNYFVSTYPPFSRWKGGADQVWRHLEQPPASPAPALGLYVHIPFCVQRCKYCYYLSHAHRSRAEQDDYVAHVLWELGLYRQTPALEKRDLSFVYFGGGTPSILRPRSLHSLFDGIQTLFSWSSVQEATFECAPQTVTLEGLEVLKKAGITRLSMGVQQLDNEVLARNGRVHVVQDVERAYAAVQQVGFPVVNLDLMVGMLGETEDSFFRSLDRIIDMAPDSVTLYQLEIPLNTPLYKDLSEGVLPDLPPSWEIKRERLGQAFSRLEEAGYTVRSGYSAVRDPQAHPFIYQDAQYRGADLLGVGVSSFSYLGGLHSQNSTSVETYESLVENGELPIERTHLLSAEERLVREFVLQLKLGEVQFSRLNERIDPLERFKEPLAKLAQQGWLCYDSSGVRLTREGLLRVDHLLPSFYLPEHRGVRYS